MSKQKKKKYTTVRLNNCKMCKTEKIHEAGLCKKCSKALATVSNMLNQDMGFDPEETELWQMFMAAVFASIEERRVVIKKITGDTPSYFTLALLEATEVKQKNRTPANYVLHMDKKSAMKAMYFDEHGRMPTAEEFEVLKNDVDKKVTEQQGATTEDEKEI